MSVPSCVVFISSPLCKCPAPPPDSKPLHTISTAYAHFPAYVPPSPISSFSWNSNQPPTALTSCPRSLAASRISLASVSLGSHWISRPFHTFQNSGTCRLSTLIFPIESLRKNYQPLFSTSTTIQAYFPSLRMLHHQNRFVLSCTLFLQIVSSPVFDNMLFSNIPSIRLLLHLGRRRRVMRRAQPPLLPSIHPCDRPLDAH